MRLWRVLACVAVVTASRAFAQGGLLGDAVVTRDIVYAKSAGGDLKLDVYLPPGSDATKKLPVILRVSAHAETPMSPAGQLLTKGYALVYAQYLPEDAKDGVVFTHFPADEQAVKAAIRWVRGEAAKRGFDQDRIGLWAADNGATLAALAAVTPDQKDLNGTLGDYPSVSSEIRAVCLFGGTTDWRNAELYGDETINIPGSPAYQFFGGNAKDFPDDARKASAVNYVRPTGPATLMVTLASDTNRAMHLMFAETLRRAGVASALYEEAAGTGAGIGGRAVDEARLSKTILAFFNDTLADKSEPATQPAPVSTSEPAPTVIEVTTQADTEPATIASLDTMPSTAPATQLASPEAMAVSKEVQRLMKAGLFKQARRILEEQVELAPAGQREPWLKLVRQLSVQQQQPALNRLAEAIKANAHPFADDPTAHDKVKWTIREVLTDPDRIGDYQVEATVSQQVYDMRWASMMMEQQINDAVVKKDWEEADKQALELQDMASSGIADLHTANEVLARYLDLKRHPERVWPIGIRPVGFASDFGQDMYGNWFEIKAGGATVRFRFVPGGKFMMGSDPDEWGRLPGEKIAELTEVKLGFWIEESPVTQALWEGVLGAKENRSFFKGPKLPVENMSYAHAVNFLDKVGVDARLPTQTEWEYACRAMDRTPYAGTGRLSDMAWYWEEKEGTAAQQIQILHELESAPSMIRRSTHDVMTKYPNRWGIFDMQGEVWQWCSGTSPDRPVNSHVARGGSWISVAQSCRAAREAWFPTELAAWHVGMRMVVSAQPQVQQ